MTSLSTSANNATKPINYLKQTHIYELNEAVGVIEALKQGLEDAVIIDVDFLTNVFPGDVMVKGWNSRVKKKYRVNAPISPDEMITNFAQYKGLPGITGGMWHTYATKVHDAALDSPIIDSIFTDITGTSNWQAHPNRMRFNTQNNDKG